MQSFTISSFKLMLANFAVAIGLSGGVAPSNADAWGGVRLFEASLSASNQTTLTRSNGVGLAKMQLDIETNVLSWEVTYRDLTSAPTAVYIHGPSRTGINAERLLNLAGEGLASPVTGSREISRVEVQYLLLGRLYVLLSSKNYPNGELRGRVDRVPPPNFRRGEIQ